MFSSQSFRKHQKKWMAALMVLCMASFVILPTVADLVSDRESQDPIAATTSFHDFHESEMTRLRDTRAKLNAFMQNAVGLSTNRLVQDYFGPVSDESVIDTLIMSRKADRMGLVINDEAINNFLKEATVNRITPDQMRQLIKAAGMSQAQLFNALRLELMSERLQELMLFGNLESAPPLQRWDYYRRVNAKANIEFIPIEVSSFLGKVPEPTEAQLLELYNAYKNDYPKPGSPEPGFHHPKRARFQYFKAVYNDFYKPDEVTQEDIAAHYEKFKAQRYKFRGNTAAQPGTQLNPEVPATEPGSNPSTDAPTTEPGTEPQSPAAPTDTAPGDTAPMDTAPMDTTEPTPDQAAPNQITDPAAAPETPTAPETPAAPEGESNPQASLNGRTIYRGQDPAATEPAATEPAPETPPSEPAATDTPATEAPADAPATEPAPTDPPTADAPPVDAPATGETAPATSEPTPEFEPLEKVQEEIRTELASQAALKRMQDAMRKVSGPVDTYYRARKKWELSKQGDEPVQPDYAALAAEQGLTFNETQLLSANEINVSTDIGRSTVNMNELFPVYAYEQLQSLYEPRPSMDFLRNQYLFWKVEETPDEIPKFEQIKDEVAKTWKLMEARKLAEQYADEMATAANRDKATLADFAQQHEGLAAHSAGPFSWVNFEGTFMFAPNAPPQVTEIEGVTEPGNRFMEKVFSIPVGETGVAFNSPETVAYLVRPTSVEPSEQVLRTMFMSDNFMRYRMVGTEDRNQIARNWIENLEEEVGLDWARQPLGNRRR
jgi:hypothetical protein